MSYYPDTDEIRMAYVANHRGDGFGNDAETLGIEFDRWFEYEQKKVAKATEQRIIKLLEDAQVTEAELFDGRIIKVKCESVRADLLIALIKGEGECQKDNESVVILTERDYDQLSDAVKGEGENK